MTAVAGIDAVRAAFPALQRRHRGRLVAYLDGPGGTQVPGVVCDAMTDYLLHHNANTHWHYPTSVETDAALDDARQVFAAFLDASPDEIAFGNNMTTITFHVARALARGWAPGDEVVVTELDHHGNIAPWQAAARDFGLRLRWLPFDTGTSSLRLDLLPSLLTPRTRLVAIGAASNLLGEVSDVRAASDMAHAAGALMFVDGVHYAPHYLPDVAALGCDMFVCSAYKFCGPHVGVLWGKRELLARLDAPKLDPAPDAGPERLETGTQNHEGIVGAAAAVRWLASLQVRDAPLRDRLHAVYRALHVRESALLKQLWDGLGSLRGVTRYGPPPSPRRTPTVACTVDGHLPAAVACALADEACFVSDGDFYAATAVDRLGRQPDGMVRIGIACYTTGVEIDRVLDAISRLTA